MSRFCKVNKSNCHGTCPDLACFRRKYANVSSDPRHVYNGRRDTIVRASEAVEKEMSTREEWGQPMVDVEAKWLFNRVSGRVRLIISE